MPIDHAAIAALALKQHGAFTTAQARSAGATGQTTSSAVAQGRWTRPARGVYLLAGHPSSLRQRVSVATLARPDASAALLTAAHLRSWVPSSPHQPELIVPPSASSRSSIATIHRSALQPDEVELVDGLPTTSAARTVVDLAHVLGPKRLRDVVDEAFHRRAFAASAVHMQLQRPNPLTRRQLEVLLKVLDDWDGQVRPGSSGEVRLFRMIEGFGYPRPERQIPIRDLGGDVIAVADGGWLGRRLLLEYDGLRFHGPLQWEGDEARHARIESLGYEVLHADKADLHPGARSFRDRLARAWARSERHLPPERCA